MKAPKALALLAAAAAALVLAAWLLRAPPVSAILLTDARAVPVAAMPGIVVVTLNIENAGGPDRLLGVHAPHARMAQIANAVDTLAIPAGATPALSTEGANLMLMGLDGEIADGRLLPVMLIFEQAGEVSTRARMDISGGDAHAKYYRAAPPATGGVPPTAALAVAPDGEGWRVTLHTTAFTFSRENADGPHVPGEGHAHLYLNGLKLARLYGPEARIGALPPGAYEVRVTLNSNDHRPYSADGMPVAATATITVR